MAEVSKRNVHRRIEKKKFDWKGSGQIKPKPINRNGIPIEGERQPRRQNFPGGSESQ